MDRRYFIHQNPRHPSSDDLYVCLDSETRKPVIRVKDASCDVCMMTKEQAEKFLMDHQWVPGLEMVPVMSGI